jgi:hypothetical protein
MICIKNLGGGAYLFFLCFTMYVGVRKSYAYWVHTECTSHFVQCCLAQLPQPSCISECFAMPPPPLPTLPIGNTQCMFWHTAADQHKVSIAAPKGTQVVLVVLSRLAMRNCLLCRVQYGLIFNVSGALKSSAGWSAYTGRCRPPENLFELISFRTFCDMYVEYYYYVKICCVHCAHHKLAHDPTSMPHKRFTELRAQFAQQISNGWAQNRKGL